MAESSLGAEALSVVFVFLEFIIYIFGLHALKYLQTRSRMRGPWSFAVEQTEVNMKVPRSKELQSHLKITSEPPA